MSARRTPITQAMLARCLRALRTAGFAEGRVVIEGPDGVKVSIVAGKALEDADPGDADEIDAMIDTVPDALP